ncbi:tetratricopeptide repeat protein [Bacillus niameyensis]|uniref:hypothetical protein n=1 Tax=Bacillus niameyensis TaxID=1522308 RepID=UPI000783B65C|nr:hypothetical protein [Bacillus niameyensis]
MKLKDKTIEELLDLEAEFREQSNEEDVALYLLTSIYEELYKKILRDLESEYDSSLGEIKNRLIAYLVQYGTYMKTQYQKDDRAAESSLKKAIQYNRELPIAYYRLGFLSYKKHNFALAADYFQKATKSNSTCRQLEYKLNQQQLYNTYVYLMNSFLYMAENAQATLKDLETQEYEEQIPDYNKSSLYETIQKNERYLNTNAFTVLSADGNRMCTKEECERIIEENALPATFILYFSDRHHSLFFNGRESLLNIKQAEMLRYFFLRTNKATPATKNDFARILESRAIEIPDNSFVQTVRRLNQKVRQSDITANIIENYEGRYHGQVAYFYNQIFPYAIIFRSDSSFILDGN